jgi:hypothetical protein
MRKALLAALALLTLTACAGMYVGGDIGPRRMAEPASPR